MAPTILRLNGIRIVIYPKDHQPPHVHVYAQNAEAKFEIQTLECISSVGFKQRTLWKIQVLLSKYRHHLMEVWNEYQDE